MNSEAIQRKNNLSKLFGLPRRNSVSPRNDALRNGFFSRFTFPVSPHYAFTLAEVLIVMGIIGIVAEMTLPSLMHEIQDMHFKTAAKKAYSTASQVIQQMKQDYDEDLIGKYLVPTTGMTTFYNDFSSYFKVMQSCGTFYGCVPNANPSAIYESLTGESINSWQIVSQFTTLDGMFWSTCSDTNYMSYILIMVDVNGYLKPPNAFGRDVFFFQIVNNKLTPMGAPGTGYTASSYCSRSPHNINQGAGCMYYVMQGLDY